MEKMPVKASCVARLVRPLGLPRLCWRGLFALPCGAARGRVRAGVTGACGPLDPATPPCPPPTNTHETRGNELVASQLGRRTPHTIYHRLAVRIDSGFALDVWWRTGGRACGRFAWVLSRYCTAWMDVCHGRRQNVDRMVDLLGFVSFTTLAEGPH